jgi:thioredoxin reductase (NADPH)
VPAYYLRQALAELPGRSELIVRAFIMRRRRLERDKEFAGLRILAQDGSREGRQLDDILDMNHIPHTELITSASACIWRAAICLR